MTNLSICCKSETNEKGQCIACGAEGERVTCPKCGGHGFTQEHANNEYCYEGDCRGCPFQEPCELCEETGKVPPSLVPKVKPTAPLEDIPF